MDNPENKVISRGKENCISKKGCGSPPRRNIKKAAASANEDEWKKKSDGWKAKIARDYSKFEAPDPTVQALALADSVNNVASSYYGNNFFDDAKESDTIEDDGHAMGFHERYDKMRKGMAWIDEMRAKKTAIKSRPGPWGFKLTKAVNPFVSSDNDLISAITSGTNASNVIGTASKVIDPMRGMLATSDSDDDSDYNDKKNNIYGGASVAIASKKDKTVIMGSDDESDYGDKENNMDGGVSVIIAVEEDVNAIKSPGSSGYLIGETLSDSTSSDKERMTTIDSDVTTFNPWSHDAGAMDVDGGLSPFCSAMSFKTMVNRNILFLLSDDEGMDVDDALNAVLLGTVESDDEPIQFFDGLSAGSRASPERKLGAIEFNEKGIDFNLALSAGSWAYPKRKLVAIESKDEAMDVDTGLTSLRISSSPLKRSLDPGLPSHIPAKRAKRSRLPGVGVPLSERPRDRKKLIKLLTVPRNKGFLDAFEKRHLEPFLKKPVAERMPEELKLQIFADAAEQWFDKSKCFHVITSTNGFELSLWQGCRHHHCNLPVGLQVNKLSRDITLKVMFIRALKSDGLNHYVPSVAPFMYQGIVILDLDRKEMVRLKSERELSEEYRKYVAVQRLKAWNLLADRNLKDTDTKQE